MFLGEMEGARMALVSVVMANYNGEQFLDSAVESILTQTYEDLELVIVDDGSTDGSRDIVARHARRDRRVRAVLLDHCGLVKALNHGCGLAAADFIARLDSDDIAKSDRLSKQLTYMLSNPDIALVGGAVECIDVRGNTLFIMNWPSQRDGLHDYLLSDCHVSHTTVLFRKHVFWKIGGYRLAYADAEDYDLFLRMSDHHLVDNLPDVLCQYRLHANQISACRGWQQVISGIAARLATRARRSNRAEPRWKGDVVSRDDLIAAGIKPERVDSLIREYSENASYSAGWRWAKKKFCELPNYIV
jgi:glycosyltransferase involved in cell wall biosynthesis